jgi:hypothetical protein
VGGIMIYWVGINTNANQVTGLSAIVLAILKRSEDGIQRSATISC